MRTPVCLSSGAAICYDAATVSTPQRGYYCQLDTCIKCSAGTYGPDGKTCKLCPFATWAANMGESSCSTSFSSSTPGLQLVHIPFGVSKIVVKLWGGGGGSDKSLDTTYVSHSGGSGGFTSCNVSVTMSSNIYVIVAGGGGAAAPATATNAGGFGGGGLGYAVSDFSAGGGGGLIGKASEHASNGRGATEVAGGDHGFGLFCNGTAGSKYQGGNGCKKLSAASAGGGGGYYGGGGGSGYGSNNKFKGNLLLPADGGGGGGSSYVGGCLGSYTVMEGVSGNSVNASQSGGVRHAQYVLGVGVGGAAGGSGGGPGLVILHYIADKSYASRSPLPSTEPSPSPTLSPTAGATATSCLAAQRTASTLSPGGLSTYSAIVIFSSIGGALICIFFIAVFYHKFK